MFGCSNNSFHSSKISLLICSNKISIQCNSQLLRFLSLILKDNFQKTKHGLNGTLACIIPWFLGSSPLIYNNLFSNQLHITFNNIYNNKVEFARMKIIIQVFNHSVFQSTNIALQPKVYPLQLKVVHHLRKSVLNTTSDSAAMDLLVNWSTIAGRRNR
jgi:hypothetical protein